MTVGFSRRKELLDGRIVQCRRFHPEWLHKPLAQTELIRDWLQPIEAPLYPWTAPVPYNNMFDVSG